MLFSDSLPRLELAVGSIALVLEPIVRRAEVCNGLFGEELFQCPLLDGCLLLFPELLDVTDCILQDGSFVLLASRDDLG